MADNHDRYDEGSSGGFMMGLLTGTVLGAGLGMLLAPRAGSELRGQLGEQAKHLSNYAADQYRRAGQSAGEWAERGRGFVDRAREAVSHGMEESGTYAGGPTDSTFSGGSSAFGSGNAGGSTYGSGTGSNTDFNRS